MTCISQNCNYTLSGTVIDAHDNSPLFEATLVIAGYDQEVTTNITGYFSIPNLCDKTYSIQVYHENCTSKGYTIKIDNNTSKTFRLEHHVEALNEITLKGEIKNTTSTITESKLNTETIEEYSGGSIGDALNTISGVSSLNTGNTIIKPIINGLHSSRVVMINNGVRMEDQEWGAEHAPNIDINSAGNIILIKGAGALQYSGDAVGGVIITSAPKVPVKDTIYGKTIMNRRSNGQGGAISSKLTKSYQSGWYSALQGTIKQFGDFESPDYILSNTGAFERGATLNMGLNKFSYGFNGYFSIFKNEIGILRSSHIGGAQDQINAIKSDRPLVINPFTYAINPPKQEMLHRLVKFSGFKRINGLGKLSLQYSYQRNNRLEFDVRRGDNRGRASLDLELDTHNVLLDLQSDLSESTELKTGIALEYQNNFANPETNVRRLIPDYEKYDIGAYGVINHNLNDNWLMEAGLRLDYSFMDVFKFYRLSFWESRNYDTLFPELVVETFGNQILTNPELSFTNLSATAGVTYKFDENNTLFLNYSLASRSPNPSELFSEGLHHSASRIELGDLTFSQEIANKIGLSYQRKSKSVNFTVNPFLNFISDFILIEPSGIQQTIRGNFQVWEYRQTEARLLGVDFDANVVLAKNLSFNHQFSLVEGFDKTLDRPLISIPATNTVNTVVYNNAKLNNLKLSLQSELVFEKIEFPNTNVEVFNPGLGENVLLDLSTPPEGYHLLHFKSSIDFKVRNTSYLSLALTATNLLNTTYRNYLNRLRYYADDLGRSINLNIKINY